MRRRQVMLIRPTRWMDERVVASEKCGNGIEEKMPEISREVNEVKWLKI